MFVEGAMRSSAAGGIWTVLVQSLLSVCFYLASGFADFRRPGPRPKFPERWLLFWFEVELLFLDFLCQLNAPDRHSRRLESLKSEHRPDSLLYPAMILLDYVVQILAGSHPYAAR
jgi:hypothetical protein